MSAELLREAASLARERANGDGPHIIPPAVDILAADWLDDGAERYAYYESMWRETSQDPRNRWAERGLTVEANLAHHFKHELATARALLDLPARSAHPPAP